jgi:DNA end-binding protein Ku
MAPRSSWKGFLRLSLVSVPVKAFTANNTAEEIRLNQLHKECNARVKYKKVCPEHGELKSDQIVSGYQYAKDQYVVIVPDEMNKLRRETDHAIGIDGFVPWTDVDPMYLSGRTYYLLPDGPAGNRPYALLRAGMEDQGLCAIAQVVMSGREQLVLVRPVDDMLVMNILTYSKNVKTIGEFNGELEQQELTKEEKKLTKTLIDASILEAFDFEKYKDQYVEKLGKLIKMKIDGEEVVQAPDLEEPKIINLMDALKKSVAEAQSGAARKMAPSVKSAVKKAKKKTSARKKKTG